MDTTQLTHISLCSGYGGIDLGIRRVLPGLRTVAYSEIEEFACGLLASRMESGHLDPAPIWTDLKTFPWASFRGKVDILSGGYPCQPFSAAGLRKGADDPRHLWPAIAGGISILQPALCFFENVEGHISLGLQDVIRDLGNRGYTTTWGLFSAAEVGAPHQRKRVFILAHKQQQGSQGWLQRWTDSEREGVDGHAGCGGSSGGVWPSRPGQPQFGWEPPRVVADSYGGQSRQERGDDGQVCSISETQCQSEHSSRLLGGEGVDGTESVGNTCGKGLERQRNYPASEHRTESGLQLGSTDGYNLNAGQTQPSLGGDTHGFAGRLDYAELCVSGDNRTDELRLLGNGVVPATAAIAFTTLMQEMFP